MNLGFFLVDFIWFNYVLTYGVFHQLDEISNTVRYQNMQGIGYKYLSEAKFVSL